MAASDDILRTYRHPRVVMREHLARPASEPRALVFLLLALTVIFIGQWPRLSRLAHEMPDQPMVGLMMGTMLALLATVPIFYLIAALGHLVAKAMGGQGSWYGARLALFWALLAVSPLMLLQGLVAGFIGIGPQLSLVSLLVGVAFVLFWIVGLRVAEFEGKSR
ncbi:MAG: YIP1 family protein [Rhodobacteraceae bacterium]|jgi:hypothetical protein|uniref:Yip1 family protein n=1 Tax=Thioclava sp. L04-15 TaxID=1915318 RepID=UPI0009962FCD|nr:MULTISPECIES: Yip1 family protein [unclassified Thioclava]MBD3802662.1 YIP1 family protein [Thioclava sp.]OOY28325.1 hypothetical protein BMI90_06455 [Thioclava sp. L04-15]TNE83788.1 MAG: YIP1 family protein [Paracoccaceae bacterium]TNF13849.1 MAG: YIP1 family protein [Paracoccaceae bacterium]